MIRNEDCEIAREVTGNAYCRVEGCGIDSGLWRADSIDERDARNTFRVLRSGEPYGTVELALAGEHNVRNALAVVVAAHDLGLTMEEIAAGLASFEGVARRLEVRGEAGGVLVLDDFAHHPTAVVATLRAVRARYAGRRLWAVLEPRSWSLRRNVFQQRLAESFDDADRVIVAGVFRPEAIPAEQRLDPDALAAEVSRRGRPALHLASVDEILTHLVRETRAEDVVIVMSNGGFGGLHGRLLAALAEREGPE